MAYKLELLYARPDLIITSPNAITELDLSEAVRYYSPVVGPGRVSESVTVRLPVGRTDARQFLRDIESLFRRAREADLAQTPPRVFLSFTPDGAEQYYVAQVYDGRITPGEEVLTRAQSGYEVYEYVITWARDGQFMYPFSATVQSLLLGTTTFTLASTYHIGAAPASRKLLYNSAGQTTNTAEVLDTGDGATTSFSGTTAKPSIYQSRTSPVFKYRISGTNYSYSHDQLKTLPAATTKVTSATLNFVTGAWALVFADPPDNGIDITLDYINGYGNWVQIDGQIGPELSTNPYTVLGERLSEALLTITNQDAAESIGDVWIGCYLAPIARQYPKLWYEAESAALEASGVAQGDPALSEGAEVAWPVISTTETIIADWTLDSQDVRRMGGKWYAPIVKWGLATEANMTYILFRWQVYSDDGLGARDVLLWSGDQYRPTNPDVTLHQLGLVQLPPNNQLLHIILDYTPPSPGTLHLVLTATSVDIDRGLTLDAIQLMPTDFFCKVERSGGVVPTQSLTLYSYDGIAENTLVGGGRLRTPIVMHDYPRIDPTRDQRWYFLWTDADNIQVAFDWPVSLSLDNYSTRGAI
jgi:hypothetical protein